MFQVYPPTFLSGVSRCSANVKICYCQNKFLCTLCCIHICSIRGIRFGNLCYKCRSNRHRYIPLQLLSTRKEHSSVR